MSKTIVTSGLLSLLLAACGPAVDAAPRKTSATPETLPAMLARAGDGDVIVLAPGRYRKIVLSNKTYNKPLTIDATGATLEGLQARNVTGLTITGGHFVVPEPVRKPETGQLIYGGAMRFDNVTHLRVTGNSFAGPGAPPGDTTGPYGEGYGVFVLGGSDVTVANGRFQGLKNGIVLTRIDGFSVSGNRFAANRSDGINVAESRNGVIEGNECAATRIRDDEHPDCIQLWSRPPSPPVADVVIRGNRAEGNMQGIGMFNHVRNGVDDGGFDRITIENNDIRISYPQGIAMYDSRGSIVRNNRVSTLPGAKWRASINVGSATRCGNEVASGAGKGGEKDPACKN